MTRAGFFETDITPAVGMEMPGGYGKCYQRAYRDRLKVRAGVIDDGKTRVALVGIDTCVIAARTVAAARAEIEKRCGIPGGNVMIGASHTHSGGPLFGAFPDEFEGASALVKELALNHSTVVDLLYQDWVVRQIATAVYEADRRREKALLSVGKGQEGAAGFNRRFRMKSGRSVTHPGKVHPDIVEPAGPIDPDVGVLAAWRPDGALLGCVINYTCHGTTGPGGTSADWITFMDKTIHGAMGGNPVTVFLNGAAGDVTQVNNRSPRIPDFGEESARKVGMRVGAEALKVLVSEPRGRLQPVAALSKILDLPRRAPSPASLKKARELVQATLKSKAMSNDFTFAKERLILDYLIRTEPVVRAEVQAIQVGPAVYLSNGAEFFCQLGLDIKAASPFPFTFVVELANGSIGYVPTEEAFAPTGGGYETVLTSYSNLEPDAGPKIVEASVALARRLKPGAVPRGKLVKTQPQCWDYGIRGPDLD
ncbi:MAG: hypothetical protein A3K19_32495 [Lentisphaerae bacterium RIFOXYB12_FULL_65_16]|nr:MAG: hypothetical protein A3K18_08070 [Lentisphaerae bacterium RIFOXYA12_64_32]OGV84417.1 MAG: hypothetical protein A3K19_32495 [Lentisphaerae bacterium RIFOXYB12_FULL_65_16]